MSSPQNPVPGGPGRAGKGGGTPTGRTLWTPRVGRVEGPRLSDVRTRPSGPGRRDCDALGAKCRSQLSSPVGVSCVSVGRTRVSGPFGRSPKDVFGTGDGGRLSVGRCLYAGSTQDLPSSVTHSPLPRRRRGLRTGGQGQVGSAPSGPEARRRLGKSLYSGGHSR